jgi:formylglycine-generating enzyme required for sulfatase activity
VNWGAWVKFYLSLLFFIFQIVWSQSAPAQSLETQTNVKCSQTFFTPYKLAIQDLLKLETTLSTDSQVLSDPAYRFMLIEKYQSELKNLQSQLGSVFVDLYNLEKTNFINSSRTLIQQKARTNQQKNKKELEIKQSTVEPFLWSQKMIFYTVMPGQFKMGQPKAHVEITKPFQMMATPVTQFMWLKLKLAMGEKNRKMLIPSGFSKGLESEQLLIDGEYYELKPHHPVEQITWEETTDFIEGLNQLSNSTSEQTQSMLKKLIPDHHQGDEYDLPTEAEWEFVMKNRGRSKVAYFDKVDESELKLYAWYDRNAQKQTHAVAQLLPRIIDDQTFFDLEGNVSEWVKDIYGELKGGTDPQGALPESTNIARSHRGGSWENIALYLSSGSRSSMRQNLKNDMIGFRLVRRLK